MTPERAAGSSGKVFRSLRTTNFRRYSAGQLFSQCGNWASTVAQILFVLARTDSGVAVGGLVACQFGPVLVLGAWAGVVADRRDRRGLMMITQVGMASKAFALAIVVLVHGAPLGGFYAVVLAGGFVNAFDNPVRRAIVGELVPEEDVHNAISLNSALNTAARIFGPTIAGLLIETAGYTWCFVLDGVSYVVMVLVLRALQPGAMRPVLIVDRAKGQVRAGLRYVRAAPELWIPLVMLAVLGTFSFNFQVVLPLFVERTLGGGTVDFTILFSVLSAGAMLGALASARAARARVRHTVTASLAFAVAIGVLALTPNLALALPVAFFVGVTSVYFITSSSTILQLQSDASMRGRVMALQSIVLLGSTPIGGPILGAVADRAGAAASVWLGSIAAVVAAAWAHARLRAARRDVVQARARSA